MNIIANRLASACKQEQKSQNYYYIHASCKSLFESQKSQNYYYIHASCKSLFESKKKASEYFI